LLRSPGSVLAARTSEDSNKPQAAPLKNPIDKPSQSMTQRLLADSHEILCFCAK
jgi:hypothetical protein